MSDSLKNTDEGDVLASVRRMVSHADVPVRAVAEKKEVVLKAVSEATPATPAQTDVASDQASASPENTTRIDRLVLTPETRVSSAQIPTPNPSDVHAEPNNSTPYVLGASERTVDTASQNAQTEWHAGLNDTPDEQAASQVASLTLAQRITELENAVEEQSKDWISDGSDEAYEEGLKGSAKPAVALNEQPKQEQGVAVQPAPFVLENPIFAESASSQASKAEGNGEEESPNDTSDVTLGLNDSDVTKLTEQANENNWDEDALRKLIGVVIHEELQGVLQARSTKSVRSLVRKEVQEALVTKKRT